MTPRRPSATPTGDPDREARHRVLTELLAPYLDGELPAEAAARIDAHLLGCGECRRVLAVHATVRDRLTEEPVRPASSALRDRIGAAVRALPAPTMPLDLEGAPAPSSNDVPRGQTLAAGGGRPGWPKWARWVGSVAAVAVAAAVVARSVGLPVPGIAPASTDVAAIAGPPTAQLPMIAEALGDYRRVMTGEIPGRARDLAAVRATVPFPVVPLDAPDTHLVSVWTTTLRGEPVAALAYRWGDRVVVQYVVSERLLFRQAEVRRAIAARRVFTTADGAQGVLAWADPASGVLLIGDATPAELAHVRGNAVAF